MKLSLVVLKFVTLSNVYGCNICKYMIKFVLCWISFPFVYFVILSFPFVYFVILSFPFVYFVILSFPFVYFVILPFPFVYFVILPFPFVYFVILSFPNWHIQTLTTIAHFNRYIQTCLKDSLTFLIEYLN